MNGSGTSAGRRRFLAGSLALALPGGARAARLVDTRRLWRAYRDRFIQADGRVIDHGAMARSTSEGQAYALFHARVAGDADCFRAVLRWTRDNLCGGDLTGRLPAWSWGRRPDGRWDVLDENNATDADLMIAYCLAEAEAWLDRGAAGAAREALLERLAVACVRPTTAFGPVLLPAARGFEFGSRLRLNPSYLMLPLLRRAAGLRPGGGWAGVELGARRVLLAAARPRGLARDWIEIDAPTPEPRVGGPATGGFDAIRVYLWCGLAADRELSLAYRGLLEPLGRGVLPAAFDAESGEASGAAPPLLEAALLPWLAQVKARAVLGRVRESVVATLAGDPELRRIGYYEANLALFAEGWWQRRFRFLPDGRLWPVDSPR